MWYTLGSMDKKISSTLKSTSLDSARLASARLVSTHDISNFVFKRVYILVGFTGSGKSTLGKRIASQLNCEYLSSDEIREKLTNQSRFDPAGDAAVSAVRERVYQVMYEQAAALLKAGKKVVLDATHIEPDKFEQLLPLLWKEISEDDACCVTVKTRYKTIDARMKAFANVKNSDTESVYEAWKRVYGYMVERQKQGLVRWPAAKPDQIAVFSASRVLQILRKTTWIPKIGLVAWDLDGTLYPQNDQMNEFIENKKMEKIAAHLQCSPNQAQAVFSKRYAKLKSATRVLDELGIAGQEFYVQIWKSIDLSRWIEKNTQLGTLFKKSTASHAMLTNSNTQATVTAKLQAIGLKQTMFSPILTSVEIGYNKPDLRAFAPLAALAPDPKTIVYIGDKEHIDIAPACTSGLKTIIMTWSEQGLSTKVHTQADLIAKSPMEVVRLFS